MSTTYQLGTYLENFLDSVSGLPQDLRRNFALMADLDSRSQELLDKIKKGQSSFLGAIRTCHREGKREIPEGQLEEIRTYYRHCLEFADEKVALAVQTYRMVDKHIQRLDGDLKKFEADLSESQQAQLRASLEAGAAAIAEDSQKKNRKRKFQEIEDGTSDKKGKGPNKKNRSTPDIRLHTVDLDMPIDPNEPTYCFCNRVSFGNMVGCDNADCPVEWFHFECVGLTSNPKGKWLCPDCAAARKKQIT